MATQLVTRPAYPAGRKILYYNDNVTTLAATGSGNGFKIKTKPGIRIFLRATLASTLVTVKSARTQEQADLDITLTDNSFTMTQNSDPVIFSPDSDVHGQVIGTDAGYFIIEANQIVQIIVLD